MSAYSDQAIALSPAGYWRFGESSGATLADAVGGNPLTLAGSYSLGQAGAIANDPDTSIAFSGGYATGNTAFSYERTQAFSVSIWFYLTDLTNYCAFAGNLDPANGYRGWELGKESTASGGPLQFFMIHAFGSNYLQVHSAQVPTANAWHHYVVTYDGSSTAAGVSCYYDGALLGQAAVASSLSATTVSAKPLRIAARADTSTPVTGRLDEPLIVARVMTAAEVLAEYNYGIGSYGSLLLRRRRSA